MFFIDLLLIVVGLLTLSDVYGNIVQLDEGILEFNQFLFRIIVEVVVFIAVIAALITI
jgi:hypothetical protein